MTSNAMSQDPNQHLKNFKATYLRVLTSITPDQADWWAAKELIDMGHATGNYQISRSVERHGEITTLVRFAPTASGRLFADDLAEQLKRQTWRYRLVNAGITVGGLAGGWLISLFSDRGKAYVLGLLGM